MTEHRSHHRAEPTKKTVKDYAWIGAAITTIAGLLGGHAYDRTSSIDHSQRMHRSTLRHNAEKRAVLEFRVKLLEREVRELHGALHSTPVNPRHGGGLPPGGPPSAASGWPSHPESRPGHEPPRGPPGIDAYDKIMQEVEAGGEYQPKGYGY